MVFEDEHGSVQVESIFKGITPVVTIGIQATGPWRGYPYRCIVPGYMRLEIRRASSLYALEVGSADRRVHGLWLLGLVDISLQTATWDPVTCIRRADGSYVESTRHLSPNAPLPKVATVAIVSSSVGMGPVGRKDLLVRRTY